MGGPQVRIAAVACALKGRVDTTVIVPEENSEVFRARLDERGIIYKAMPITGLTRQWTAALRYIIFSFLEVYRLAAYFREHRFDVVHVSGGAWQYKGVVAGKLAGCAVAWHLNDTSMPWLIRRVFALFSRLADGYIFASERSRKYYGELMPNGKDEFVIPAPVDTIIFDPALSISGDEALIAQWADKRVIGTVGNVNRVKGFDYFIRMAAALNRQYDSLQFVVVGPIYKSQQRYYESLVALCQELGVANIVFVGARADVRPLLKRFDVYVCSSRAESSPISVWEAMAMAKPIVSTDVGDVALHVKDGGSGYIVNVGDVDRLAQRIGQLIEDDGLCKRFGESARMAAVSELGLERCARQHLEAYTKLASTRSTRN